MYVYTKMHVSIRFKIYDYIYVSMVYNMYIVIFMYLQNIVYIHRYVSTKYNIWLYLFIYNTYVYNDIFDSAR